MKKTIITTVGKNGPGIIAKICTYLSEQSINILDISQTIVQGYFNMIMVVDTSELAIPFAEFVKELSELGNSIGVDIRCQRSEIFDNMHRI